MAVAGTQGTSQRFEFKGKEEEGKEDRRFEKGAVDIFTVTTPFLGQVKQVHVGHNDAGPNSPWALDRIEVLDQATGARALFLYSNWLSKTEGPRRTDQELNAK